jgi:2-hydroxychromene-2-carboxylate isomerase
MSRRVEFFYDYVSPFSYLADTQLSDLAARTGAEIVYRPMVLGGVMKATGNSPPITVPAKGKYMAVDLQRWSNRYGVPMNRNPHFPMITITALRGALVTLQEGGFPAYQEAVFRAVWCDQLNVADADVLRGALEKAGLDAARILERCSEPGIKEALKASTAEAVERGAFGAPTYFVGDEMFFGNDRLPFVEEALRS